MSVQENIYKTRTEQIIERIDNLDQNIKEIRKKIIEFIDPETSTFLKYTSQEDADFVTKQFQTAIKIEEEVIALNKELETII